MSHGPLPPGRYFVVGGEEPDERRASFRVMGDRVDPEAITEITGLEPQIAYRKGDPHTTRRGRDLSPHRSGMWSISSENELSQVGTTVEEHLVHLLDRLEPSAEKLRAAAEEHGLRFDFYCGYFMRQSNSGWQLSPETLRRIADLGACLGFDVYGPPDDYADRSITVG